MLSSLACEFCLLIHAIQNISIYTYIVPRSNSQSAAQGPLVFSKPLQGVHQINYIFIIILRNYFYIHFLRSIQ